MPGVTDPAALAAFLERATGGPVEVHEVTPIPGGYSRIMVRFTATVHGERRDLIARADPPPEQQFIETSRDAEWALLSALRDTGLPTPAALHYDESGEQLGSKAIVLECAEGDSLLALLRAEGDERWPEFAEAVADLAAALHAVPLDALPATLERPASWEAYVDGCVEAWRMTEAAHVEPIPAYRHIASWLDAHRPPPAPLTLVHGEFQPSNVMVGPDGAMSAVDWELARIGDPREDLGWCAYVGAGLAPPDFLGPNMRRACARYRQVTGLGDDVVNPATITYFGLLPLGRSFALVNQRLAALAGGEESSILAAYTSVITAVLQAHCLQGIAAIEAAKEVTA